MRAGRDESELQNWPWKLGDFTPNSHFKNSCWWKEIGRSWLTLRLFSVGVAAVCPIDPVGNGGGWSLQ